MWTHSQCIAAVCIGKPTYYEKKKSWAIRWMSLARSARCSVYCGQHTFEDVVERRTLNEQALICVFTVYLLLPWIRCCWNTIIFQFGINKVHLSLYICLLWILYYISTNKSDTLFFYGNTPSHLEMETGLFYSPTVLHTSVDGNTLQSNVTHYSP